MACYREILETLPDRRREFNETCTWRPRIAKPKHDCKMYDNSVPVVEDGEGVKRGRRERLLLHGASVSLSGQSLDWLQRQVSGRATAAELRDRLDLICSQLHELSLCTCMRELGLFAIFVCGVQSLFPLVKLHVLEGCMSSAIV